MQTNGVNYYKGVLLCSRPNQSPSIPKQKPFCGRVTAPQSLGLVPCKKFDEPQIRKRNLPVLSNHKKWLESFKKKITQQKQLQEEQKRKEAERLQKIKQQGVKRRQMFKKSEGGYLAQASPNKENNKNKQQKRSYKSPPKQQKSSAIIDKENTKISRPQAEKQEMQDQQVDELLDFFGNEDTKDYLLDQEVKKMMKDLKHRIEEMKNQANKNGDWKKKQLNRIQQAKEIKLEKNDSDKEKKDDILSRISKNSDAKSMVSQKTAERVQELQRKKKEKQWDKNTVSDKKSHAASVDLQIAKNIADEVLRNYPHLKHHSNQSIRKLLQKQAHQQIKA